MSFTLEKVEAENKDAQIAREFSLNIFQSPKYGSWQKFLNREFQIFCIKENGAAKIYFQIILYKFIFNKKIAYIPYGPIFSDQTNTSRKDLKEFFLQSIERIMKENKIAFLRLDEGQFLKETLPAPKFSQKATFMQPRKEWKLELSLSAEDLFKNTHKKTSYAIEYAKKKDVTCEIGQDFNSKFVAFYSLLSDTAKRNNFYIYPKDYYQNIFADLSETGKGFISEAFYQGKVIASNIVVYSGDEAYWLFGASSDEYKNLSAPHLLKWQEILHAKSDGMKTYNFGGIAIDDTDISLAGVTKFKKRFGGYEVDHLEARDILNSWPLYWVFLLKQFLKTLSKKK